MAQAQPPTLSSPFERVLQDFKRDLTPGELKEFGGVTLVKLEEKLAGLQQQQKKRKTMQNLARIQGFIETMKTYSGVLDVFVNAHNFVAFIWGPMKFLLLTASNLGEAFNGLLDAYKRITEHLPLLEQYQSLFGTDRKVEKVLELTFRDIFQFHREALAYFRKPGWKLIFHSTWGRFNATFGTILDSLDRHKSLLMEQASLEHFHNAEEEYTRADAARRSAAAHQTAQEEHERLAKLQHLACWLSPPDVHADQDRIARAREGHPHSCRWIQKKDLYRAWYDTSATAEPTLWIHGIPGAGKSVLASFIVEETVKLAGFKSLFFYCRHDDPQRDTFVAMARAFLWDLVQHNDTIAEIIFDASVKSSERLQLRSQKLAGQLLDSAIQAAGKLAIVLDGIDECIEQEQKHIVRWLKKYIESSAVTPYPGKCVFLSQYDSTTKSLMSNIPTLRLSAADNKSDIEAYCKTQSRQMQQTFSLDSFETNEFATKTATRAAGMFLFARLVMQHLLEQTNLYELREETHHLLDVSKDGDTEHQSTSVFNKLDIAYSRILRRIVGDQSAPSPRQRDALQLLKWLVCALRPLTWEEIQTALSIDFTTESINIMRRRQLNAKDLCGSLVDMGQHGEVDLVHSTAKVYLEKAKHVYPPDEHLGLASLCMAQMCFPMFEVEMHDPDLDRFIEQGSYGLLDYSIVGWNKHLELGLKPRKNERQPPKNLLNEVEETLESLLDCHYEEPAEKSHVPRHFIQAVQSLSNVDLHERTLATMSAVHKLTSMEVRAIEQVSTLKVFPFLFRVRERLEQMLEVDPTVWSTLEKFYGANLYKCSRPYCEWFHIGFRSPEERRKHREKHERAFYCPHAGCVSATLGWATKKELDQHVDAHHKIQDEFPPENDEHDNDLSKTSRRAQKHPATFKCNLCPKRFTRNHNLRSHLRVHTDVRPFLCTVCGKSFARQSDRMRHEGLHSGEKKFVCRGTLQDGHQWGCGRRFARANALGVHFRSEAGGVCIKPLLNEEAALRQRAWLEEQQIAAGIIDPAPPAMAPPDIRSMSPLFPAALLTQYPALQTIDWIDAPGGSPPGDKAYSGRSSYEANGGEYYEDVDENEMGNCPDLALRASNGS